jgi:hypothetical protein
VELKHRRVEPRLAPAAIFSGKLVSARLLFSAQFLSGLQSCSSYILQVGAYE